MSTRRGERAEIRDSPGLSSWVRKGFERDVCV